jgi:hypothetical protein
VHEVEVEVVPDGRHLQHTERRLHTTRHDTTRHTHTTRARPRAMSVALKAEWCKGECTVAILRGVLGGVRRSSWERLEMGDSEVAGVVAHSTASPARRKGQKERNDKHARTRNVHWAGLAYRRACTGRGGGGSSWWAWSPPAARCAAPARRATSTLGAQTEVIGRHQPVEEQAQGVGAV